MYRIRLRSRNLIRAIEQDFDENGMNPAAIDEAVNLIDNVIGDDVHYRPPGHEALHQDEHDVKTPAIYVLRSECTSSRLL